MEFVATKEGLEMEYLVVLRFDSILCFDLACV